MVETEILQNEFVTQEKVLTIKAIRIAMLLATVSSYVSKKKLIALWEQAKVTKRAYTNAYHMLDVCFPSDMGCFVLPGRPDLTKVENWYRLSLSKDIAKDYKLENLFLVPRDIIEEVILPENTKLRAQVGSLIHENLQLKAKNNGLSEKLESQETTIQEARAKSIQFKTEAKRLLTEFGQRIELTFEHIFGEPVPAVQRVETGNPIAHETIIDIRAKTWAK